MRRGKESTFWIIFGMIVVAFGIVLSWVEAFRRRIKNAAWDIQESNERIEDALDTCEEAIRIYNVREQIEEHHAKLEHDTEGRNEEQS